MSGDGKKSAEEIARGPLAEGAKSGSLPARPPLMTSPPGPGDVLWIDMPWAHIVGHEQAKSRPWVVISGRKFHRPFLDLVIAVPLTSQTDKAGKFRGARILIPEDAITSSDPRFTKQDQLALTEHVRSLSLNRSRGQVGSIEQAWVDSLRAAVRQHIA